MADRKPWEEFSNTTSSDAAAEPKPWETFGGETKPEPKGFLGHTRDLGLSAVKSAIAVPETLVGLADIPTGGRVGKFLENEGGAVGFRPKQTKEFVSEFHTDQYKDQQRQFQEADGILDKTSVAIQNPSLIANTVVESAAPMLAGGVTGRAVRAVAPKVGAAAAGAIGEGTMMAGAQAEAIRQETDDGLLTAGQSGAAVATGLAGTLFGYLGGRVAQRFGLGDVDTMLARGANPQQVASEIAALPAKSIPRQVIEGAISEGFLEELPQSISEQIIQNLALGKDWSEGVEDAAVMGTLAGMAMGGGASLYNGMTRPEPQDGGLPPPAAGNEPPAAPPQGFAPTSERPVIDEAALGRAGVFPPAPAPIINERALEPLPSQQMGLDPAAGPMSAAAALAVDTGASATMQQAAQVVDPETGEILEAGAKAPEQKQATDTPEQVRERLGFIEQQARVNGGWDRRTIEERDRLQAELAKVEPAAEPAEPAPAIDVSGRTDEQLRVLEKAGRDGWREAAVAEIQRRAAQQMGNAQGDTLGDDSTPAAKAKGAAKQVLAQGGSEADAGRAATDSLIEDMAQNPGISIAEQAPAAVKAAKAEIEKPSAAPQADAAPAADIKAVIAKQIPDMTDGELQQAIAHYGPAHKRTAKLQKELQKRGQGAQAPVQAGAQVSPAAEQQPAPSGVSRETVDAVKAQTAEILAKRLQGMKAGAVNQLAARFLPTMGLKPTASKERNIALLTDGAKVNLFGVAGELGVELSTSFRQALEADMAGTVADRSATPAPKEAVSNVPTAQQVAPQAEEARGQEGEKAKWIKAAVDKSRLNGSGGVQLAVAPNGGVTFMGDPNTSKDGRALLANYEKALAAGATQQEIAAAIKAQKAQGQAAQAAPEQDRRPMPSGLSFPSERIVTNVQGEFEALEVQASSIGTSDGYVNFGSQYPDGRYYIESAGKSIGFANGQWGDVTPEGLKPRGTYDPDNLQAETIRVLEGEGAKRSKAAEPARAPADAARPDEGATAQPEAPEFTTLKDRDGKTITVRTADLSSARERMPTFTKEGKRRTAWIHRDNLDPTGEKQAEGAKEMAGNPLFDVISTRDGSAFASEGAAERELRRLGLQDTHEVAPASEVSSGSSGFVVRRADTAEAAAPGAGMPSITAADITEPSITRRANPGNMGDRQYVARAFLKADGSSIMGTGNDEASALLDMMRDGERKRAGTAELLEAAEGEKAWNELSVPFGRTMALERAGVKLPAAVHWKNISPENRAKLRPAVKAVLEESDGGAVTARPQPGDDGYTLELAREDLAALRAELKKQGEDGRPVDSRLNDRVRNFEKLVASMESAQKREQPAQASDDDIDAMFDDALADAIGEQRTGEAEPTATAEAPAATAVTTEQPANQEAMAESLEDELRAQKKRVQRLRGGDATKLKVAEARLRAMRQSIFDAEDKWVPAARNGDQEALTKLEEAGFADTADAIRAFAPAAPRTAGKALKSAAKNAASALDDAINGLGKLFGGSGRLSSGLTFDEETYAKAKPLFIAAAANIRAASRDLRDVMKAVVDMVVERFGADTAKNMKPYVTQFVKDVRDGKVQLEQEQEGDEPAADGAQDQGRAEAVRGGRGDSQPGSAPADSGSVAPRQSEDGRPAGEAGDSGRSGVRVPGADVARGEGQPQGRASGDGRARTGGAGSPDAGAGGAGNAGDLGRVSSPAATSAQALDLHVDNPLEIVGGSPVQRFNRNRAALELLQTLTEEGRQATPDEQKVLAGYIGWGSFGQELFQGSWERPAYKDEGIWKERGQWLRETLGESAWKSAQRSITNAHYTDPPTVLAMWDMVRRMGFDGGKVLEPSMGTGNFFSMMPADLKARSQLTGIELDETTGAIAKQLFPRSNVRIMGYQDSKTPDGFYDLIIGNWPFENTPVADRRYNKLNPMLHDYFFLKTMDQVRPGGIVIGITSAGSMDKQNTTIRRELAKQAELVAAIRLPSGAFEEYAGTKVVTDIVVLRKRPQRLVATPSDATWVETGDYQTPAGETIKVNRYYLDNPQNIIGTLDFGSGTTTFRAGMIVRRPDNMAEQLQKAIELVPQGAMLPRGKVDHLTYYANETGERHGALALVNDRLMIAVGDQLVEANEARKYALKDAKKTAVREQQLRAAIELRKKHAALVDAERGGRPADDARKALRGAYDAFVKAHGGLRDSFALEYLERINDPFFAELAALENDDGTPAAVMERSTTRGRRTLDNPSVRDAYVLARNQSVNPSVAEVARLAGKSEQAVKAELLGSGAVFEAPNGDVVPSDIYLSGNVRQKLREAQAALDEGNAAMSANIAALKEVMPEDVPYFNIETQFGATWVPNEAYAQYIAHMLGQSSPKGIEVSFRAGRWKVKMEPGLSRIPEAAANYGTPGYPFSRLVQAAISNQVLRLTSKDENGNDVYDAARTEEANARIAKIREDFGAWLWSDPERRQDLEREYNEARNAWATPTYDGSFLTFEGMALTLGNGAFQLRQHQVNAIWRAIVNRRSINAHEVGTGKTFTMGGIAVESRRYGIAKKPMLLAHNANSATVAAEIRMMYPSARVLYVDNLQGDKKEIRLRQIANDDWDVIVVPHSLISSLALREETMMRMAEDDIKALEAEFFDAAREDNINPDAIDLDDDEDIANIRSVTAKELAKARKRIIENIKKQAQKSSKEGAIAFEDLGVDMILVDEAHEFKKPPIVTRMKMKGLNTQVSNRSIALQFLTRYVRQMNNGGNVHTFTGTPITNTITEIYHQMRYVMEAEMEQATIADWDGWFGSFAAEVQDVELTAAGDYEMVSRLAGFVNVPELRAMVGQYMDTVFAEDMPEMRPRKVNGKELSDPALTEAERAELLNGRTEGAKDRPYKKVVNDSADMTSEQMRIFTRLQQYAREWRAATGKQKKEWMRAGDPRSPIITEGIANKASFDVRLLDDEGFAGQEGRVPDEPTSKASRVVKNVLEIYNSHPNANQVIFSETGFGKRATRSAGVHDGEKQKFTVPVFATMHDIVERLVQGGIPREQIAIVDGSTSKERRKEIAEAMNSSKIRIVIGSTDTLGVGVNMQRNLRAMHHVDAPYMPGELEQRNGRGLRQGNQWNTVLEYRYMTDRLDGKRWQILAVKQRFINAFMKAAAGTRVIEGEAAADEQSDILESFSEAAGDPRILQRVKMQKKLETLHRKERMYTQGIADMRRQERISAELADRMTRELKQLADSRTQANVEALIASQQQAFAATIDGTTYDTRKDAADALQAFIEANVRIGDSMKTVGEYAGHPLRIEWPRHMDVPVTQIDAFGQEFAGKGIAGAEAKMRNFPSVIENKVKRRDMERSTAENMRAAMNQPFAQAADLERITKQLQDLEKDLEINPVPPPAWLRQGAPIDSEVHRNKRPYIVTGHRYSKEGWFVIAEDDKGTVLIPYMEATDEVGMPMYEEREFVPPVVIEKEKEGAAPADAPADVVFDRAAQSATANPLRNADGTFARQDPAGDSLAFSATLPLDRNAVRIGITEKGLVRAMRIQFDGLAEITSKLLERGRAGKRGGVIVVGTADNAEIGRIVAERTGRKLDSTMRKFSSAGRLHGFYDPKTGLTFLVGPNLNPVTATAVMLHEMMHGQQRQKIDARALEMVRNRHSLKDEDLRAFLDRVMLRMIAAGEVGNAAEASAYIVEQAVIEGRSAGYSFADNAFMQWVDAKIGKRVGDFLRSFAGMIRTWMLRNGLGAKAMTVDDFVGYAMAGLDRAAAGEVRASANAGRMASMSDRNLVASAQAPNPAGDGTTGGATPNHRAAAEQMLAIIEQDDGFADFAVRVIPDESPAPAIGEILQPSRVWDDGIATDEALPGTSAVGIEVNSLDGVVRAIQRTGAHGKRGPNGYYPGSTAVLVKGEKAGAGADVGEVLLRDAEVVGIWKKPNDGLSELIPNEPHAPSASGAAFSRAPQSEAFRPNQIKSAIGNSGTFDPDNDDIRFSRSGMRELASRATTELNQTLTAPGKLSWWHKTIGTMYNLAERSPTFKPVFQAAQGFIDDVSHYAADAAERAPKLLPRLDTWRDILKSPISAEDNTAVGKPIFEGTLSWTRDADGRPVLVDALTEAAAGMTVEEMADELVSRGAIEERTLRMWRGMPDAQFESAIRTRYENSFLQPGIVWTDDELVSLFSLTPAQIALYREFRAAVDRSLDTMARADMLRFAGEDVRFLRDPVMEAETLREAASLIVMNLSEQANAQPDRAEQLMATGQGVMDRMQKVMKLQAQGYAPLSRFGKYTVDVVVDGNREYFGLFETAREANKMAERMRAEFGAGTVTQGTLSDEAFRLFAGITPESLELFGNMLGLDSTGDEAQDRAFQEYLRLTKTNRSALRRLIHRKGIAGFSEDVGRVLASFAYSNARQTAAGLHMGDLSQAVSDIPKEQGELKDVAVKLAEYIKNPQEEAQAIRGLLFAQYLGGSVASAFVNMTQPAAVTFPWLSQHGGAKMAAAEIGKAAKHIATRGHRYESDLAEALKAAEEDGVVSPQEVHQLMAQARGSGSLKAGDGTRAGNARALASNSITRLSAAWGKLFSAAEQLNRRITFIAAYRVAKQKRMEDPAAFARRAVQETQFVYSKASKMQWGRGAVGGTLMTFKTYSVAYMELMSRLWSQGAPGSAERKAGRKAVALMLAMVLLMGGGGGLPFMEDMEDLIDGIAQIAGYNFSTKKARQQFLIDTFGADASDFIERGVSGLPGVPLDVSGRLGLGNLIPGTGMFLDRSNHTRDILELLGPVGDLGSRFVSGARKAVSGDIGGALLEVSPVAVRNVAKGVDMAATDQYRDYRGYKVLDTNDLEAALKAIGFQPAGVAKIQDANYLNQRAKDFYNLRAQKIRGRWAEGIYEKDPAKVQEAREMVAEWNADNPGQPMIIRMPDILRRVREMGKDKAQRIADTAPRAMRQQLREELLAN